MDWAVDMCGVVGAAVRVLFRTPGEPQAKCSSWYLVRGQIPLYSDTGQLEQRVRRPLFLEWEGASGPLRQNSNCLQSGSHPLARLGTRWT